MILKTIIGKKVNETVKMIMAIAENSKINTIIVAVLIRIMMLYLTEKNGRRQCSVDNYLCTPH